MKTLVTFGSERGGTREIAARVADELRAAGHEVDLSPAGKVESLDGYQAVVLGGALYAFHWHRDARRFVLRFARALRRLEVWFFSSGPLDESATERAIPPVPQVRDLMGLAACERHVTFGGRLEAGAKGFPAEAMAKTNAGDWRDWEQIRAWSKSVAESLALAASRGAAPTPRRPSGPPFRWWSLVTTCAVTGLSALLGGLTLMASPSGAALQMPLSLLEHSPFDSFLVPGLLLAGVIGLGNLSSALGLWRRLAFAPFLSAAAGVALLLWIAVQMLMLRSAHWLQLSFLGVGLGIVTESVRMMRAVLREIPPLKAKAPPPARPRHA